MEIKHNIKDINELSKSKLDNANCCDDEETCPDESKNVQLEPYTFTWCPENWGFVYNVYVTGTFSNWKLKDKMTYNYKTKCFECTVMINPKVTTKFKYVVDGRWITDSCYPVVDDGSNNCNNVLYAQLFPSTHANPTVIMVDVLQQFGLDGIVQIGYGRPHTWSLLNKAEAIYKGRWPCLFIIISKSGTLLPECIENFILSRSSYPKENLLIMKTDEYPPLINSKGFLADLFEEYCLPHDNKN
ncbi:hypothetical protein H8356DRAFT_71360 [Neocallimastix lanati (nom. inval.)]|jgi:hypothetical protein|uniref:AMP-activated protein kinase glycogen-binding domain-containing protein n=1 Tax=Neocallimastix californiae TaxID=1754190 RepID=A0A1Y2EY10_9FUNG|nr:hypothetical protein H8356DRAFT_71360 [Neocallimastix sp. JGI-2020a]ORY76468.1 hypothetical protein LY90DRAFT_698788 [Neocallimastix californiae]|eukprot:ORY76468.1 hypothetical protein LY90DRAFT_698788 [Neocallimastix californiae]